MLSVSTLIGKIYKFIRVCSIAQWPSDSSFEGITTLKTEHFDSFLESIFVLIEKVHGEDSWQLIQCCTF